MVDHVLEHVLHARHVTSEVAEGHLGLNHPELGGVATGVGVLGAERGTKGVDIAKGEREVLGLELAGDREVSGMAEEVLRPVDGAGLGARRVLHVERGHAEHLAGALSVGGGDDRRVHVDEAALLEEAVDGVGCHGAHAKDGAKEVGAAAQVLLGAQELAGLALLLHRVVRGGGAGHHDLLGLELEGLRAVRGERERARDHEGRAHARGGDLVVVGEPLAVHDDLEILEARAVVEHDEAKVLHVTDRADPAGNGDGGPAELVHVGKELRDVGAFHGRSSEVLLACFPAPNSSASGRHSLG